MFLIIRMLFFREGQPLKLPETKKTLLFTFNGEHFISQNSGNKYWFDFNDAIQAHGFCVCL